MKDVQIKKDVPVELSMLNKVFILILLVYNSHEACAQDTYIHSQQTGTKETLEVIAYPEFENPLSVIVRFDNYNPGELIIITILNSYKRVLYRESVRARRYGKRFNFSELPDGEYLIKVFNKRATFIQKFGVETLYKGKHSRVTSFDPLTREL